MQKRNPRRAGIICLLLFGGFAVFAAVTAVVKDDPLGWAFAALAGGFALMSCVAFAGPAAREDLRSGTGVPVDGAARTATSSPGLTGAGWAWLLAGAAVISVGPLLLRANGMEWGEGLGAGGRSGTLLRFSLIIWGGAAAIVVTAVQTWWRGRSQSVTGAEE